MRAPGALLFILTIPASASAIPSTNYPILRGLKDRQAPQQLWKAPTSPLRPVLKPRQSQTISSLRIPTCALSCYINTLTSDGCAEEVDFECHCRRGNLLSKADRCVRAACGRPDQDDAKNKLSRACQAIDSSGDNDGSGNDGSSGGLEGGSNGRLDGGSDGNSGEEAAGGSSSFTGNPATNTVPSFPNPTSQSFNPASSSMPSTDSASPTASDRSGGTGTPPDTTGPTETSTQPTDKPFAPLPPSHPLSAASKAGISVTVTVFASAIFIGICLYIRRLKRQLALAKAAADIPESIWRSNGQDAAATPSRSRSWSSGRGRARSRRGSWNDFGSPVSPLSPTFAKDGSSSNGTGSSIAAILGKKAKRGHVLSVVVEGPDEDASSVMRMVREPVPGQSEGLADPLELDGEDTRIVELPTSVTPRARSAERGEDKDYT